jgi:hypothetical protein
MLGKATVETLGPAARSAAAGGGWMPLNDAVAYTSRSASTLRRAVDDGALPRYQPDGPGTKLYFTRAVLDAYMRGERWEKDGQDEGVPQAENENAPAAATAGG